VCRDTLIVVEGNFEQQQPLARLCGPVPGLRNFAWYHYSHGWYREVLKLLGFRDVSITVGSYRCHWASYDPEIEFATVVAVR
jgi:hypothetical protein